MILQEQVERKMFDFVDFLKRNNLAIPDKDVAVVFKMRYDKTISIAECSYLLSLLESQNLLDSKKSVNKAQNFYTEKHKLFIDFVHGKHKI